MGNDRSTKLEFYMCDLIEEISVVSNTEEHYCKFNGMNIVERKNNTNNRMGIVG